MNNMMTEEYGNPTFTATDARSMVSRAASVQDGIYKAEYDEIIEKIICAAKRAENKVYIYSKISKPVEKKLVVDGFNVHYIFDPYDGDSTTISW